jgi:hypothetical protein
MHLLYMQAHVKYGMGRNCEVELGRIQEEVETERMRGRFNVEKIWPEPLHAPTVRS